MVVSHQRECRARSPSGLMLESIDSPQGDQVARTAAMAAIGRPRARASAVTDMSVVVLVAVVVVVTVVVVAGGRAVARAWSCSAWWESSSGAR